MSAVRSDDRCGGYDARTFVAEFYDQVPLYANRRDVSFYLDLARAANGSILELGCGTGRLLVQIAHAGFQVDGIDLSDSMLAICKKKLESETADVRARATIRNADMTAFDLGTRYALVIAPFRCFQHLVAACDQLACLQAVHRHLAPQGTFVLDLFNPDPARMHDPAFMEESVEFSGLNLPDGRTLGRSCRISAFHPVEQYNDTELIYYVTHPDGRKERLVHDFPIRLFFHYEVEHLLTRCGYTARHWFGDYDRSPLRDGSPEMIVVAEKR
jgi:SAM-dependent methyltransferase